MPRPSAARKYALERAQFAASSGGEWGEPASPGQVPPRRGNSLTAATPPKNLERGPSGRLRDPVGAAIVIAGGLMRSTTLLCLVSLTLAGACASEQPMDQAQLDKLIFGDAGPPIGPSGGAAGFGGDVANGGATSGSGGATTMGSGGAQPPGSGGHTTGSGGTTTGSGGSSTGSGGTTGAGGASGGRGGMSGGGGSGGGTGGSTGGACVAATCKACGLGLTACCTSAGACGCSFLGLPCA